MKRGLLKYILSLVLCIAAPVHAGGPLSVCSGVPTKYPGAGTVTLNYDRNDLGTRTKAQADALVTEAVSLWTNVGTATVTLARGGDLPVDVTTANVLSYIGGATYEDGLNPVIYDTDGSIIDMLNGVGAKNSILGFAGSAWYVYPTYCQYAEGRAVINGYIPVSDTTLKVVLAHEIGHLIGLDHTQLDGTQGLSASSPSNYPLMYPMAYRGYVSLHEDDAAAVSALYPDATLNGVYGQLTGTFTLADGTTPIRGANLWAEETTTHQLFSIASDYLEQNTGYFKLLLPAGTYTLHAEAVQTNFTGGSSVGPYSNLLSDPSFQPPLYNNANGTGGEMSPMVLGNGTPTQITITAGCAATVGFKLDGTGTVSGNCSGTPPSAPTIGTATAGNSSINVTFTPGAQGSGTLVNHTADCGGFTNTGAGSPITVTGLANGTSYTCKVKTITTAGTSPWSALSNATTPFGADDGFPSGGIPAGWTQPAGSNASWVAANDSAYGGSASLKSGSIDHSRKSDISYTATFTSGTISFARRVSSEAGYDFLEFYIDGIRQDRWAGEVPWSVVSFPISAGSHTLLWRYIKDYSVASGGDAAWIDSATLPPPPPPVCSIIPVSPSMYVGVAQFFSASCTGSPASYQWAVDGGNVAATQSTYITALPLGPHTVSVTATNAGGSGSASTPVTVNVFTPPSILNYLIPILQNLML